MSTNSEDEIIEELKSIVSALKGSADASGNNDALLGTTATASAETVGCQEDTAAVIRVTDKHPSLLSLCKSLERALMHGNIYGQEAGRDKAHFFDVLMAIAKQQRKGNSFFFLFHPGQLGILAVKYEYVISPVSDDSELGIGVTIDDAV